ncbi:gamma-glutamylcyclotransferase family protein [Nocardia sp. NPDC006044]|uniref:gamma-glutamylcyclotransferase family protein n=1 Tax=Nocardia sp. NPDC006044 TaxID=3364306 RepID=UPI0036AB47F3
MEPSARRWEQCAAQGYSLFVYGTLQFPEVLDALIGRVPQRRAATVTGWRVAALPGLLYPGLVPEPDALARGLVLRGLNAAEWAVLDAFEDDQYDLRAISLPSSADRVSTYVWTAAVAQDDWHPDQFTETYLPDFVAHCADWRRGF